MTPPATAIIAFAVLFGHPVLQMALIGFGARSFAIKPFGRIATYGSAALAGGVVALALHKPAAPLKTDDPPPASVTTPTVPVVNRSRKQDQPVGETKQTGPMVQLIEEYNAATNAMVTKVIARNRDPSLEGKAFTLSLTAQQVELLVRVIKNAQLSLDPKSTVTNVGPVAYRAEKSFSDDAGALMELEIELSNLKAIYSLDNSLKYFLDLPRTRFQDPATFIFERKSGISPSDIGAGK